MIVLQFKATHTLPTLLEFPIAVTEFDGTLKIPVKVYCSIQKQWTMLNHLTIHEPLKHNVVSQLEFEPVVMNTYNLHY